MTLRVALAQVEVSEDVPTRDVLVASGERIRAQIARAGAAGARLVCFPEGTLTYPGKKKISKRAPALDDADWSRCDWDQLRTELDAVAATSAEHGVWTLVGAPHRLGENRRPRNSLHLIDPAGAFVGRVDKRMLSVTERTYL